MQVNNSNICDATANIINNNRRHYRIPSANTSFNYYSVAKNNNGVIIDDKLKKINKINEIKIKRIPTFDEFDDINVLSNNEIEFIPVGTKRKYLEMDLNL